MNFGITFLSILVSFTRIPRVTSFQPSLASQWRRAALASSAHERTICQTALFCQLLGLNSASPTQFNIHWPGFCERGGKTDVHADGWGLAYYLQGNLRQFHDLQAACDSPLAKFLGQQPLESSNVLAHIRYATQGQVDLSNVHPFSREMWGIQWSLAHNGEIPLFKNDANAWLGSQEGDRVYHPVGDTDSERFFCALLNSLRAQFTDRMPSLPRLYDSMEKLCQETVDYDPQGTILNFMLTCGPHALWVYSWPGSRPGSKVWNGLHYKITTGQATSFSDDVVEMDLLLPRDSDRVAIVATKPLTDDGEWVELQRGELLVMDQGIPYTQALELFHVELQGHGLESNVLEPPRLKEDMRQYSFDPSFYAAGSI